MSGYRFALRGVIAVKFLLFILEGLKLLQYTRVPKCVLLASFKSLKELRGNVLTSKSTLVFSTRLKEPKSRLTIPTVIGERI